MPPTPDIPTLLNRLTSPDTRTRWNLTTVLGHLPFKNPGRNPERAAVIDWLFESLSHPSGLVRTKSLQALYDLSTEDPQLRARAIPFAHRFLASGTPAMRARACHLLKPHSS